MSNESTKEVAVVQYRGLIEGERWEIVEGGDYAVSDHGRVMRTTSKRGAAWGKLLAYRDTGTGYWTVGLHVHGRSRTTRIHILVANAFLEPSAERRQVNHKDGNKHNNVATNLEWATHYENAIHAHHNGLKKCKLSEAQVAELRRDLASGMRHAAIARKFNVTQTHVSNISRGKARRIVWEKQ